MSKDLRDNPYGDWKAIVNTSPNSDFGRYEHVEITMGVYQFDSGKEIFHAVIGITPTGTQVTTEDLAEGHWPSNRLELPLEAARALHEALVRYFQFSRAGIGPEQSVLQEALNLERKRVDKVLDKVLG